MTFPLSCPVCYQLLRWGDSALSCPSGHSFDIAREGYVNLYRTSRRSHNQPGDSKDMLRARRSFLDGGHYDPLSDLINEMAAAALAETAGGVPGGECVRVLDAGCGEGRYLARLKDSLRINGTEKRLVRGLGIDIAKEAVRMAAKRFYDLDWCVANGADRIPCPDGVVDLAISVFAPRFGPLLRRVLRPKGILLIALPGPDHLTELNTAAMAESRDTDSKESDAVSHFLPYFEQTDRRSLRYELSLCQPDLGNLLRMIPVYWRSTREAREKILTMENMKVTADFVVLCFRTGPPIGHHA